MNGLLACGVYQFEAKELVDAIRSQQAKWEEEGKDLVIPGNRAETICYTVEYVHKTKKVFIHLLEHGKIGAGAHATVSKSVCLPDGQILAHKVPDDCQSSRVFHEEVAFYERMRDSRHVVQCVHLGKLGALFEYLTGGDCSKLRGKLSEPELISVADQLEAGVRELHERGIVHRDLRPENVLVARNADNSLTVKIGDLGCATDLHRITRLEGRVDYRSIALLNCYLQDSGSYKPAKRDDYHALAVTIYELAHGKQPDFCKDLHSLFVTQKKQEATERLAELERTFTAFCDELHSSAHRIDQTIHRLFTSE